MGSLIPTQADLEICDNLTTRFSIDQVPGRTLTWLKQIQDHHNKKEKLFGKGRKLVRVAYRLAISVTGGPEVPSVARHRQRWFHLLRALLPPETDTAIRQVLTAILDPTNNIPAKFSTQPAPIGLDFELYPQNSGVPFVQYDNNFNPYYLVMLDCKTDTELKDPTRPEHDPPDPDQNEQTIAGRLVKRKRERNTKKPTKKSSAKKSSSKKSLSKKKKAVGKKAPAKKAKKAKKGRSRR
jgi:hypothetical protein